MKSIILAAPHSAVATRWRFALHTHVAPVRTPYKVHTLFEWDDPERYRGFDARRLGIVRLPEAITDRFRLILDAYTWEGAKVFAHNEIRAVADWLLETAPEEAPHA